MRKLPRSSDRNRPHISNIGSVTIAQSQGFGAAEIGFFGRIGINGKLLAGHLDAV